MAFARSKYPFAMFTEIGQTLSKTYDPSVNLHEEANRIRVSGIGWAARSGLPWRFRVETNGQTLTIIRKEDADPAPVGSSQEFVPSEMDKTGDMHRKYDFGSLDKVGKHVIVAVNIPHSKRVSAHQAGKLWAKKRGLDWRFRVVVTADRMHLRIERIK